MINIDLLFHNIYVLLNQYKLYKDKVSSDTIIQGEEGCSAKSMEKIRSLARASASASAKASAMALAVLNMTDDCFAGSSAMYYVKFTINVG